MWDATLVLPESEIGGLAAFARRTGDTWFVAAMCGPQAKSIDVPLSFLDSGEYRASVVRDGPGNASVVVESAARQRRDQLRMELRGGGGFVARLVKE